MKDTSPQAHRPGQHFQLFDDSTHDAYAERKKMPEPSACHDCGATYKKGHWKWEPKPENAHSVLCSACKRIQDNQPAGYVSIQGPFVHEHKDEILGLIKHFADHQKTEHPMKRIIATSNEGDGLLITTTDLHLARGIGDALKNAYKGELDYQYNHAEFLLRVRWTR